MLALCVKQSDIHRKSCFGKAWMVEVTIYLHCKEKSSLEILS